jgi:hypothetical protein
VERRGHPAATGPPERCAQPRSPAFCIVAHKP